MFSSAEREVIRAEIIETAKNDDRITGGAMTGSASIGNEDKWSDIDLAFGVRSGTAVDDVLADYSKKMYAEHSALHHLDVPSGSWIYRVFLLPNTLQVDLAFAPEEEFGAKGPTFKLLFGQATELPQTSEAEAEQLIGMAWLYALHARSCIARNKVWQAEYMISAMRDQVLTLACLRHGLPTQHGRGYDLLPDELKSIFELSIAQSMRPGELARAFHATTEALLDEIHSADPELETRVRRVLLEMAGNLSFD